MRSVSRNATPNMSPEKGSLDVLSTPRDCTKYHKLDNFRSDNIFYQQEQAPNTNLRRQINQQRNRFNVQGILNNDIINIPYNERKFDVSKQMSKYFAIVINFVFVYTS